MELTIVRKNPVINLLQNYGLLIAMALLSAIVAIIEPKFLSSANLMNIMRQISVLGVTSLGMAIVIIGGYIDLSISGTISFVAIVTVTLQHTMGLGTAILIGLAIGCIVGLLNAGIILLVKAGNGESLIITFGVQSLLQAAALIYSKGMTVKAPESIAFRFIGQGTIGFFSASVLIFLVLAFILQFVMSKTGPGRSIYLTGGNRTAAELSGIPTGFYVGLMYVLAGLLAAVGAIILSSRTMSATPTVGIGAEMNAIMAVVIGGTSLQGGKGSIFKTIAGVVLVGIMNNALNIIGVNAYMHGIVEGAIIIAAVVLDGLRNKRRE